VRGWYAWLAVPLAIGALACGSGGAPTVPPLQLEPSVTPWTPATPTPTGISSSQPGYYQATEGAGDAAEPQVIDPEPALGGFRCKDGTISHARHRQGACSHHGGIA
jgi:hypothetical protein